MLQCLGEGVSSSSCTYYSMEDMTHAFLERLMAVRFSKRGYQKKDVWNITEGKCHLSFRKTVAQTLLNSWNNSSRNALSEILRDVSRDRRIEVPQWVVEKCVELGDIDKAIETCLKLGTARYWNKKCCRHNLSVSDLGRYAAESMLKVLQKMLVDCRRCMDATFFRIIGYTLLDFDTYNIRIQGQRVHIKTESLSMTISDASSVRGINLSSIPETLKSGENLSEENARRRNFNMLSQVTSILDDLFVTDKHSMVVPSNVGHKIVIGTRRVKFMRLAQRMLSNFSMSPNIDAFLLADKSALRVIAAFSVSLHGIVENYLNSSKDLAPNRVEDLSSICFSPLHLDTLLPCKHYIRTTMERGQLFLADNHGAFFPSSNDQ